MLFTSLFRFEVLNKPLIFVTGISGLKIHLNTGSPDSIGFELYLQ